MKSLDKDRRVRFVRALEKLARRATSSLKKPEFDEELFKAQLQNQAKIFAKLESVHLDSPYTKALLSFVNACLVTKPDKNELLSKANKLEKLKNQKAYKKDKHKKSAFRD